MLPAVHRLRRAGEFSHALRGGRRAGSAQLVVHLVDTGLVEPARIGLIVSKAVGTAVVRTRVKRRLRHQLRARLPRLTPGGLYVVRANPAAAEASSAQLGTALDRCLDKLGSAGDEGAGR